MSPGKSDPPASGPSGSQVNQRLAFRPARPESPPPGDANSPSLTRLGTASQPNESPAVAPSTPPGQTGSDHLATSLFTFRDLHNTTPLPSRGSSPLPSDGPTVPDSFQFTFDTQALPRTPVRDLTECRSQTGPRVSISPPGSTASGTRDETPVSPPDGDGLTQKPTYSSHSRNASGVSVSSSIGGAGAITPYDVRDEQTPSYRYFTPAFQSSLRRGMEIAKKSESTISEWASDADAGSPPENLLNEVKRLSDFQASDTRTIAILGDSGEGKSSLINSLLHVPGVAKTGDIGSACTSVVTEYRHSTGEHPSPFTIEVDYLSPSEIESHLAELIWSYRQLYNPLVESSETPADDYARYARESAQAWSALEAAFRHKRELKEDLLRDQSEGALEKITELLVGWSKEIDWPEGSVNGTWVTTANTPEECCSKTDRFMQDRYWPFTKIIRVYLRAQVLKTGVILADLPGLQDTNLARVRATEDYLMKCNNIFIVAKISRAITDQSLKSSLFSVLARHAPLEWEESGASSLKIAVVCTKSEDIDIKRARQEFCGDGKRIAQSLVDNLDQEISSAKDSGNRALKKELKKSVELLLIEARNNHIKEGLQHAYATKVPNGRLDVFCVSNKLYGKYSSKGNTNLVVASGIPELRRFCHSITAEAQLREAQHFLQSALFSFVNSLGMWARGVAASSEETKGQKESLREVTGKVELMSERWEDEITTLGTDFNSAFREHIVQYLGARQSAWESGAEAKGLEWHSWHWTQYNAWCLNSGNHSTAKRGHQDWNRQIVWKMRTDLAFQWSLVEDEVSDVFQPLFDEVRKMLEELKSVLLLHVPSEFRTSSMDGIEARIRDWDYKSARVKQSFAREVSLIRRYAEETNHNSFILREMLPAYRSASSQSGGGKASRQRSIVQGRITDGMLFPSIFIALSSQVESLVQKNQDKLLDIRSDIMGQITEDINLAFASSNRPAPRDNARAQSLLAAVGALKEDAEEVGRLVAEET